MMHLLYLFAFNQYIYQIYVKGRMEFQENSSVLMFAGMVYPFVFEFI